MISDSDKKHLFQLFSVVIHSFGTDDMEWFCVTETILNTLFNIKTRNSPEYAKYFIGQLIKKLYIDAPAQNNYDDENAADQSRNDEGS